MGAWRGVRAAGGRIVAGGAGSPWRARMLRTTSAEWTPWAIGRPRNPRPRSSSKIRISVSYSRAGLAALLDKQVVELRRPSSELRPWYSNAASPDRSTLWTVLRDTFQVPRDLPDRLGSGDVGGFRGPAIGGGGVRMAAISPGFVAPPLCRILENGRTQPPQLVCRVPASIAQTPRMRRGCSFESRSAVTEANTSGPGYCRRLAAPSAFFLVLFPVSQPPQSCFTTQSRAR